MNISTEQKKAEAIERMRLLGIFPQTIQQFEQGYVSISEPPMGAFYWAEGEDLSRVREFERKHNALVYVIVRSYMTAGKMDSFLYVSDCPDEWQADRDGIVSDGEALAYVYNHDDPELSEIGFIGIEKTPAAGLRRIW